MNLLCKDLSTLSYFESLTQKIDWIKHPNAKKYCKRPKQFEKLSFKLCLMLLKFKPKSETLKLTWASFRRSV